MCCFQRCKLQGVSKKSVHSWETKTLGTSYSETTYLLDLKLWQQGVLMSTPCCQISTAYRLVVSGYEVPKVLVSQECRLFFGTPCSTPRCFLYLHPGLCPLIHGDGKVKPDIDDGQKEEEKKSSDKKQRLHEHRSVGKSVNKVGFSNIKPKQLVDI